VIKRNYFFGPFSHSEREGKENGLGGPSYVKEFESGSLKRKAERGWEILRKCSLCPRNCGINRLEGERGFCRTGQFALVSSAGPHFGEEDPLVGQYGSGTLFFTFCNLGCIFCQNYELSHYGEGRETTPEVLAGHMLHLQAIGCHNINWVTPTHVVPMLLRALLTAIPQGFHLPLVYNCGGYESPETLLLLENVVDIYMPDFKFWDSAVSQELAQAGDYPEIARSAVKEMHRQVGDLVIDQRGIARKGLLVRHLVMPNGLAETKEIMNFISKKISPQTYVNIMDQYHPCGESPRHPGINRRIYAEEYAQARQGAVEAGLCRLDQHRTRRMMI
jgi:putative pyruvate formate lyase activating enzyme